MHNCAAPEESSIGSVRARFIQQVAINHSPARPLRSPSIQAPLTSTIKRQRDNQEQQFGASNTDLVNITIGEADRNVGTCTMRFVANRNAYGSTRRAFHSGNRSISTASRLGSKSPRDALLRPLNAITHGYR